MYFEKIFEKQLDDMKDNGNYRFFKEMEMNKGDFPSTVLHQSGLDSRQVEQISQLWSQCAFWRVAV